LQHRAKLPAPLPGHLPQQVVEKTGTPDIVFNGIGSYYKDADSGTPTP